MMEWFADLPSFLKTYWVITGISTLMFLIVLVSTMIGADTDDIGDIDAEVAADTGVGFQFFTLKNLVAFFAIFAWSYNVIFCTVVCEILLNRMMEYQFS